MTIAVFGCFNALNAGDDRIAYIITRLFAGNTIVFLRHDLPPPTRYLAMFDWILVGGGGLVFDKTGIWNSMRWLRRCRGRVGVMGLGVNFVDQDLKETLLELLDRSEFFFVRDTQSKIILGSDSRIKVAPDLSWCFPVSATHEPIHKYDLSVNLVNCHWRPYDPVSWADQLRVFSVKPFPLDFGPGRDSALLKQLFTQHAPDEFTLTPLVESAVMVGCRYHAITFAMQLRKRFVAINYDSKIKRLIEDSGLTDWLLETDESTQIQERVSLLNARADATTRAIDKFAVAQEAKARALARLLHERVSRTRRDRSFASRMGDLVSILTLRWYGKNGAGSPA